MSIRAAFRVAGVFADLFSGTDGFTSRSDGPTGAPQVEQNRAPAWRSLPHDAHCALLCIFTRFGYIGF
jgi:hypothetical protein